MRARAALAALSASLLAACGGSGASSFEPALLAAAGQAGLDVPTWQACRETQAPADRVAQDVALAKALALPGTPVLFVNCTEFVGAQALAVLEGSVSSASTAAQGSGIAIADYYDTVCPDVPVGDSPVRGATTSWVTVVEFGDFECPYCGAEEPVLKQLLQDHPEVRLVFKNFPLTSIHPHAQPAAIAAECALDQGKFWEMHDAIYRNQGTIFAGD